MAEMVHVPTKRKYRGEIPAAHNGSLDTMLQWLWHQRFGTVQTVWISSQDRGAVLEHTACTLVLQAIMAKDLGSLQQLLNRLEGGPIGDQDLLDREGEQKSMPM